MCGRFVRKRSSSEVAGDFEVDEVVEDLQPSFNIAPTHCVAVVVNRESRQLVSMRWGLVPYWATDPAMGSKLINARAETLSEKAAFKEAFKRKRCLIVADGFYEWRKDGRAKTPLFFHLMPHRTFAFAGLYETWRSPLGEQLVTCTIITSGPNDLVRPIHDRMPAILPKGVESLWLDSEADPNRLRDLLQPYPSGEMAAHIVSAQVNSVKNDSPALIEPVVDVERRLLF